ncbi:MAG: metallophosphoesterase family protein [Erysipelothrix sp.]
MKIAVISDIHSNLIALQQGLDYLDDKGMEEYIFLGDYITDGYQDNEVIEKIKNVSTHAISGNRDRINSSDLPSPLPVNFRPQAWTLKHLNKRSTKYLQELPTFKLIEYEGVRFLFIHGDNPLIRKPLEDTFDELIEMEEFDVCIMGHIHRHFDLSYKGKRFINASSLGLPADGPDYKLLIINIGEVIDVEVVSLPIADTFDSLCEEYQNSNYFENHKEWGTLVLDSIAYGISAQDIFFKIVKKLLKENSKSSIDEVWDEAFNVYISTNSSTYNTIMSSRKE